MELSILEHCAKRDRERAAEKKADIAAAYPANPSEGAMKVEWDVKIERGRKSSTRKSGVKFSALMLERERVALEMAEKFSSNWFRNVQIGLELSKLVQKSSLST